MTTYGGSGTGQAPPTSTYPTISETSTSETSTSETSSGTTQVAKEQTAQVGQSAAQAGGQVAETAKDQAKQVAGEARQQARDLAGELRTQVNAQAGTQRDRAAGGLRALSDELGSMAESGGRSGVATEVARQVSTRARDLAGRLEQREPEDLLEDLRDFARRRPGAFLLGAAIAGALTGRLVKGMTAGGAESRRTDIDLRSAAPTTPIAPIAPVTQITPVAPMAPVAGDVTLAQGDPLGTLPPSDVSGREAIGVRTPATGPLGEPGRLSEDEGPGLGRLGDRPGTSTGQGTP